MEEQGVSWKDRVPVGKIGFQLERKGVSWKKSVTTLRLSMLGLFGPTGYVFGYGYCLPPYGTTYRSALRTTRSRTTTRTLRLSMLGLFGAIFCAPSSACFKVCGSGLRVQGSGFRVQSSWLRVKGVGFRFQGVGLSGKCLVVNV